MEENKYNLTEGNILSKLLLVSLPVIGTQIVMMTYNLADMYWLGQLSSDAVAASGTVGMYLWLSMAFMMFGGKGAEIGVSQSIGGNDEKTAKEIGETCYSLSIILGIIIAFIFILFRKELIGFFNLKEKEVVEMAESYLLIVSFGIPFNFLSSAISGIYNASGNSKIPFIINAISLIVNIVLDPVLIFVFDMGIKGAAYATTFAQIISTILLTIMVTFGKSRPFQKFHILKIPKIIHIKKIFKWIFPMATESFLFCFLSMMITRLVATWGADAIAAQRVGGQIESLSWLVAGGFSSAFTAYIGQNYGAKKWNRINEGFKISTYAMAVYGIIITIFMFIFAKPLLEIFLPTNENAVSIGIIFLRALASCQVLACLEGVAAGAYRGRGETIKPSITSITSNSFRCVLAYFLSKTSLGLNGIWLSICVGAVIRGVWIYVWYIIDLRKVRI